MRARRSVLFLPVTNDRAVAKAKTLPVDTVVLDLEDAVAADHKEEGRAAAAAVLTEGGFGAREVVVRINALDSGMADVDLAAVASCSPDAILVPKIRSADDVIAAERLMGGLGLPDSVKLWAMIETADAVLNAAAIAAAGTRLEVLLVGTNDLSKDLRLPLGKNREALRTSLFMCVLAARASGLCVIDGVYNAINDEDGLTAECAEGRMLGFDGKSLIHPAQVEIANAAFAPTEAEIETARRIVDAWALAQAEGKGVASVDGRMIEELHAKEAKRLLVAHESTDDT